MKCLIKKGIAECIGTFVLVFFACGTALITWYLSGGIVNYVATALAFGLVIVAMAYSIGNISGCHINPAVSLGVLLCKKMNVKEFCVYVLAQLIGATLGALALFGIFSGYFDVTLSSLTMWATNGFNGVTSDITTVQYISSIAIEIILTFVFVFTILFVTSKKKYSKVAGIVIGLTLTLVHLLGIGFTGTSVNPARSFGPAVAQAIFGAGTASLEQVWIFFVGPLAGAALAALAFILLKNKDEEDKQPAEEAKAEEVKVEETKAEEVKAEEVKVEETKTEEVKVEEVKEQPVPEEPVKTTTAKSTAAKPKATTAAKPKTSTATKSKASTSTKPKATTTANKSKSTSAAKPKTTTTAKPKTTTTTKE